eukprot:2967530-Prorocentrum_lima.AAC.1
MGVLEDDDVEGEDGNSDNDDDGYIQGDWNDNAAKMRRRKVDKSEKRKSEKKGDPGCDGSEKDKLYYCRM